MIYEVLPTKNPHVLLLPTSCPGCVQPEMGKSMGMISSISCFVSWTGPPDHWWMRTPGVALTSESSIKIINVVGLFGKDFSGLYISEIPVSNPSGFLWFQSYRIPRSVVTFDRRMLAVDSIWSPRTTIWVKALKVRGCTQPAAPTVRRTLLHLHMAHDHRPPLKTCFFWVEEHQEKAIAITPYIRWYIRHHILS